jgi:hypothetical protein
MFRLRVKNGWAVLRCNDWDVKALDSQAFQAGDIKEDYWHSAQLRPGDVLNIAYGVGFHGNSFYAGCDLQAVWVPNKPPQLVNLERLPAWTCSVGDYQPPSITFYDWENDPIYYYWSLNDSNDSSNIQLLNPGASTPLIRSRRGGLYYLKLSVSDLVNPTVDYVTTVLVQTNPPSADAGPDKRVAVGTRFQIDGARFTGGNGALRYTWIANGDGNNYVTFGDATVSNPYLTISRAGTYVISGTVFDGVNAAVTDSLQVIATNSVMVAPADLTSCFTSLNPPMSDNVMYGAGWRRDGGRYWIGTNPSMSGTFGTNSMTDWVGAWAWTKRYNPAALTKYTFRANATNFNVKVRFNNESEMVLGQSGVVRQAGGRAGPLKFFCSAVAGAGATGGVSLSITEQVNAPPIGSGAQSAAAKVGVQFTLGGVTFSDPDNDPMTYAWRITQGSVNDVVISSGGNTLSPVIRILKSGRYQLSVDVSDGINPLVTRSVTVDADYRADIPGDLHTWIWNFSDNDFRVRKWRLTGTSLPLERGDRNGFSVSRSQGVNENTGSVSWAGTYRADVAGNLRFTVAKRNTAAVGLRIDNVDVDRALSSSGTFDVHLNAGQQMAVESWAIFGSAIDAHFSASTRFTPDPPSPVQLPSSVWTGHTANDYAENAYYSKTWKWSDGSSMGPGLSNQPVNEFQRTSAINSTVGSVNLRTRYTLRRPGILRIAIGVKNGRGELRIGRLPIADEEGQAPVVESNNQEYQWKVLTYFSTRFSSSPSLEIDYAAAFKAGWNAAVKMQIDFEADSDGPVELKPHPDDYMSGFGQNDYPQGGWGVTTWSNQGGNLVRAPWGGGAVMPNNSNINLQSPSSGAPYLWVRLRRGMNCPGPGTLLVKIRPTPGKKGQFFLSGNLFRDYRGTEPTIEGERISLTYRIDMPGLYNLDYLESEAPGPGGVSILCDAYFLPDSSANWYMAAYPNASLDGNPVVMAIGALSSFDREIGNALRMRDGAVSARLSSSITPPTTGKYRFTLQADCGARLYVNQTLMIDQWSDQPVARHADVALNANDETSVEIEYYYHGKTRKKREINLSVAGPGGAASPVRFIPNQNSLDSCAVDRGVSTALPPDDQSSVGENQRRGYNIFQHAIGDNWALVSNPSNLLPPRNTPGPWFNQIHSDINRDGASDCVFYVGDGPLETDIYNRYLNNLRRRSTAKEKWRYFNSIRDFHHKQLIRAQSRVYQAGTAEIDTVLTMGRNLLETQYRDKSLPVRAVLSLTYCTVVGYAGTSIAVFLPVPFPGKETLNSSIPLRLVSGTIATALLDHLNKVPHKGWGLGRYDVEKGAYEFPNDSHAALMLTTLHVGYRMFSDFASTMSLADMHQLAKEAGLSARQCLSNPEIFSWATNRLWGSPQPADPRIGGVAPTNNPNSAHAVQGELTQMKRHRAGVIDWERKDTLPQ